MFRQRCSRHVALPALILSCTMPGLSRGEVSIQLADVPAMLSLPLPAGVNQILTVTIEGGEALSVWLAPGGIGAGDSRHVALTRTGAREYRINLGGREVYELLRRPEGFGEFRIFAKTADGATVQSISVGYTVDAGAEGRGFPWDEARVNVFQRSSRTLPGVEGCPRVQLGDITAGAVLVTVHRSNGDTLVDATLMREDDTLSLPLAGGACVLHLDRLVNVLVGQDFGVFSLMSPEVWKARNSVPDRLDFPWEEAWMTIPQRDSRKLPGVRGFLRVHLGEIRGSQVPVTVQGPNDEPVVGTTPMREGDTLTIPLTGQKYVLRLLRLPSLPAWNDRAEFAVSLPEDWEAEKIDLLLDRIAASDAVFLRNDEELSGPEFATHLRRKYEAYGPIGASVDVFIEQIAARSSSTGRPYRVRLPSGDVLELADWLRLPTAEVTSRPRDGD